MKPEYDPNRHRDYRARVWRLLKTYYDIDELPDRSLEIARKFLKLDLSYLDRLTQDRYSHIGRSPRFPSDMLRSMLLSAVWGISSYTEWSEALKTNHFLAIVSGFEPGNTPGTGTFYDFISRLWLSDDPNFSSAERPKREKPRKPARKGEKAPPIEKKPVEDLIEAFQKQPSTVFAPLMRLWEIFELFFLKRSESMGLIDLKALTLAGDGSPIYVGARERTKRLCSCRENGIPDCTCNRHFSQPDCDWGYDSHRRCYFYGYHLYLMTDPSSKHDLPIFPFLGPASRHDSHGFVHAWFAARSVMPEFHAKRVLLDAAHDALAIYELMDSEGTQALIDLNKGNTTTLECKDYTIGPDGVPVCAQGHPMKSAGFDKAQHRLKYRCPKMSRQNGNFVCSCESPCSDAKYGRQVHVYPKSNPRLFCIPPRGTDAWKLAYDARTGAERANKRIKLDYKIEDGRYRSSKAWYCRLFVVLMAIHQDAWACQDVVSQTDHNELNKAA